MNSRMTLIGLPLVAASCLAAAAALAAPKPDLWPRWEANEDSSVERVDHGAWERFLGTYLVAGDPSGVKVVRYADVSARDREGLGEYLKSLEAVEVSGLSRREQKAYWINLYNSQTVALIVEHYPVKSIRDIRISPGLFAVGPWDKKLLTVEGEELSLNDIEHRILRPLWRDNRVHYALNCASIGCPDLQSTAFTAENTEELLEAGARAYVNHPRGAVLEGSVLTVSSIYDWFEVDFGGSKAGVTEHLLHYAEGPLADGLKGFSGRVKYRYDWSLNEAD